jgi:hypothetical protein
VSRGIAVQEQDNLADIPAAFFLQNVLKLHQQRWEIIRVDSLAFWKIISEGDTVLIPNRKSFGSRRKNSKSCSDDWHRWCYWSTFRHFTAHFAESFSMSKPSRMMDPTRSREMPSCSAIVLAEIL